MMVGSEAVFEALGRMPRGEATLLLELAEMFREDGAGPAPRAPYLTSGERRDLEERLGKVRGRVEELLVLMRTREDGQVGMGLKVGTVDAC